MHFTAFRLAGIAALATLLAAPAARAQHPCPGHVSATALRPVPATASIMLGGRADSEAERGVRAAVTEALRRSGHPVAEQADYVLSWRGGMVREDAAGAGPMLFAEPDNFHDSDDLHWMQDVPRMSQRPQRGPARLSGFVELRDRESRRVVWTAVVSCERQGFDQAALFGVLTSAVVPLIGRSANAQRF